MNAGTVCDEPFSAIRIFGKSVLQVQAANFTKMIVEGFPSGGFRMQALANCLYIRWHIRCSFPGAGRLRFLAVMASASWGPPFPTRLRSLAACRTVFCDRPGLMTIHLLQVHEVPRTSKD